MQTDIDFILPWVDGSNSEWLLEKNKYSATNGDASAVRFRDWNNLRYWFRGVEKYAPWVRKVHFVTCGHYPKWLNMKHPKLNFVKHSDYIPKEYLPTFNSNVIELNFHRIKDLTENFVLFNDDFFILRQIFSYDFFKNNLPCDQAIMNCITPSEQFNYIEFNNIAIINKYFNKQKILKNNFFKWYNLKYGIRLVQNFLLLPWKKFSGILDTHLPLAHKKQTFIDVWNIEEELLDSVCKNKFRTKEDVSHWLFRYWNIMNGNFVQHQIMGKNLKYSFNMQINENILNAVKKQKWKLIGIGDNESGFDFEIESKKLINAFNAIFPQKSEFEI